MRKQMKKPKKRAYESPHLRVIEILEGPEVLGLGCKLADGGFAYGVSICIANGCAMAGS